MYVQAMKDNPGEKDPAKSVGDAFAAQCAARNDLYTFMAGAKMFSSVSMRVKQYMEGVEKSI